MSEIVVNINRVMNELLPGAIMRGLENACQQIENQAVDNCPSKDGQLRASITHKIEKDGQKYIGTIGSNAEYAPYVHEGTGIYAKDGNGRQSVPWVYRDVRGNFHSTKGQKPNPFLQNAIDQNMNNVLQRFEGCLDDS